jgi:hypothetical protein
LKQVWKVTEEAQIEAAALRALWVALIAEDEVLRATMLQIAATGDADALAALTPRLDQHHAQWADFNYRYREYRARYGEIALTTEVLSEADSKGDVRSR